MCRGGLSIGEPHVNVSCCMPRKPMVFTWCTQNVNVNGKKLSFTAALQKESLPAPLMFYNMVGIPTAMDYGDAGLPLELSFFCCAARVVVKH